MNYYKRIFLALIALLINAQALAACNQSAVGDGLVLVSSSIPVGDSGAFGYVVDASSMQDAVNLVRDCEFQIAPFLIPATTQIDVTQGSDVATIVNNGLSLNGSHLIKINDIGKWFQIADITGDVVTFTRPMDISTGTYSFTVSLLPVIWNFPGDVFTENVNTAGIHYLSVIGLNTSIHGGFGTVQNQEYGHYNLFGLTISSVGASVGSPLNIGASSGSAGGASGLSDVDVTLKSMSLVSVDSYDAVRGNFSGNFLIEGSLFESRNDVFFSEDDATPRRSVVIRDSTFISSRGKLGNGLGNDFGNKKPVVIRGQNGGTYSIEDTLIISTGSTGNVGVSFLGEDVTLTIDNLKVMCTGCVDGGVANGEPAGAISAAGPNVSVNVSNSTVVVSSTDCSAAVRNGATITFNNTEVTSPTSSQPSICENDGDIIE